MIVQSVSAEERKKGVKGEILGNANFNKPHSEEKRSAPQAAPKPAPAQDIDADSDVPF